MNTWDHFVSYRVRGVNLIAVGLKEFQNNKVAHAKPKQAGRYMEDIYPPPERATRESLI